MAKDIQTIDDDLGPVPRAARDQQLDASNFTSGLRAAFPVISPAGNTWNVRFGGETIQFTEDRGGEEVPVQWLDVVMVESQTGFSKTYYAGDFDPENVLPPTCWSSDGIRPDDSLPNQPTEGVTSWKQHPICSSCPQNARGSKMLGTKQLKNCMDLKRVAIVRPEDMNNPLGPILLRVTPASQSNLRNYVQWLQGRHRHPSMVVTRMTFDTEVTFQGKIKFRALRGLRDEEYDQVLAIKEQPQIHAILTSKDGAAFIDPEQDEQDAAGGLPPTGGLPPADTPAKAGWGKTVTPPTPPSKSEAKPEPKPEPVKETPEQARIKALEAQLAAVKAPKPEPKPEPVLTPEQLKIRELEAQLAQAQTPKSGRGRPRSKPVGPPSSTTAVTSPGNGSDEAVETSASKLSNDLNSMINKVAGIKAP